MSAGTLQAGIRKFVDYLRNEKRYSTATITNYTRSLDKLCAQTEGLQITRWRDVHTDQIQSFIAATVSLSPGSAAAALGVSQFYRYLAREGEAAANPPLACAHRNRRALPQVLDIGKSRRRSIFRPMIGSGTRPRVVGAFCIPAACAYRS